MKNLKKVVVASLNPVKINASKLGFEAMFPGVKFSFEGVSVASGVSKQPITDKETLRGALNRIRNAKKKKPDADFYIGLEGGAEDIDGELHEFAWIVIKSAEGRVGKGKSITFIAPPIFRQLAVFEGKEIGDICDLVFKKLNSKQQMGAIGLLTNGAIDRTSQYRQAVVAALIPFVQCEHY